MTNECLDDWSFLITVNHLCLAVAFTLTYLSVKGFYKGEKAIRDEVISSLFTGVLLLLFTYKGLPILTDLKRILDDPLSLVYANSGMVGLLAGIIVMFLYLLVKAYRSVSPFNVWIGIVFVYLVTFFLVFWLMRTLYFLFF